MSNPYFNNSPVFGQNTKGVPPVPQAGGYGQTGTMAPQQLEQLEQTYALPSANAAQTGRMTYDDVIMRTGLLLGTIVVVGAATWFLGAPSGLVYPLMIVGLIGGLVLGLVNAFKKEPSPGLIMAYAVLEGMFLGGISGFFAMQYNGIVTQAILATLATFAAVLVLFRSGKVRATPKFTRIVMVAAAGYLVFSLINLVLLMTGVLDGWGMRSGPLGLLIGAFAVLLASAMLVIDFDSIKRGVERGVPTKYAWSAAFGLTVTLVWMYLEFLRLLTILRGD